MDLFFQDPSVIPLPPAEVRIRQASATPYPDGKRVRVRVEVDPFQKRPCLEVSIFNAVAEMVSQARLIEVMTRSMEMTLHLREVQTGGVYTVHFLLYYQDAPLSDMIEREIEYPPAQVVDEHRVSFTLKDAHGSIPVT